MHALLIFTCGLAVAAAGTALGLQRRGRVDTRVFAALVSAAVTLSLFSVVAWIATVIAQPTPWPLACALVAVLAWLFARRLYRELRAPPSGEAR
jgi:hypothetical protein